MMSFANFSEFIAMGKHGIYVWSAYAIALSGIIILHTCVCIRRRRLQNTLNTLKKHDETR